MALQFAVALRNSRLDQVKAAIGATGVLRIRTGAVPANCAAADAGTVLATVDLPTDPLTNAASGAVAMQGSWSDTAADATGTAAHFRIYNGATCVMQGTVGTAGGSDMVVSTTAFTAGQPFNITAFNLTDGNA